jgi:hypothetical protein
MLGAASVHCQQARSVRSRSSSPDAPPGPARPAPMRHRAPPARHGPSEIFNSPALAGANSPPPQARRPLTELRRHGAASDNRAWNADRPEQIRPAPIERLDDRPNGLRDFRDGLLKGPVSKGPVDPSTGALLRSENRPLAPLALFFRAPPRTRKAGPAAC